MLKFYVALALALVRLSTRCATTIISRSAYSLLRIRVRRPTENEKAKRRGKQEPSKSTEKMCGKRFQGEWQAMRGHEQVARGGKTGVSREARQDETNKTGERREQTRRNETRIRLYAGANFTRGRVLTRTTNDQESRRARNAEPRGPREAIRATRGSPRGD